MRLGFGAGLILCGLLCPAIAGAAGADGLREPLLKGDFSQAIAQGAAPGRHASAHPGVAQYYSGLASFALRDYPAAIASLAEVAEKHPDKPVGLRAAIVATLALSRNGDRQNACQYASVVQPLTASMAPIWRVWVEEAQRNSGCE